MRLTVPVVVCRRRNSTLPSAPMTLRISVRPLGLRTTLAAVLLAALLALPLAGPLAATARAAEARSYVGTDACAPCHADQHATFRKYAKKSKSAHSVKVMASKLTREEVQGCYACHTTGYGKPGGFVSFESTPHLADAGCEVCHGPGSAHVDSGGDVSLIDTPTMEGCVVCHNEQRVRSFNFKPLLHGGAH
ncbi:multiheme c-type cytochrome [Nitratidesulfovibrio sp.]|uniref:cytochrome c family protein n=1 Tax=Nitratidesulfovibrio sp. TaxID=2802297 RepID=UPI0033427D96